ncbi:MAG TPA: hypothetical protein VMW47_12690 [Verrucomicrobiae bacterium]|nr:hypothetical protein [Verrucomicrobiae bacterium]
MRTTAAALATVVASLWIGAGSALATTGATNIRRAPRYAIAHSVIDGYLGRYRTGPQAPKSRVITSDILITIDSRGFAEGGIAIIGYDSRGNEQQVLLTLYDFHEVSGNIIANMVAPTGNPVYGHITFHHIGRSRGLSVLIRPILYAGVGPVAYRYLGGPSGAAAAKGQVAPRAEAETWHPGWGAIPAIVGRYHLLPRRSGSTSRRDQVTGGELTVFMRQVKPGKPRVPSGILHLETRTSSIVLYLTHFKSSGAQRTAIINGGAFIGPVIGAVRGTSVRLGQLAVTLMAAGIPTSTAQLIRFSVSAQP